MTPEIPLFAVIMAGGSGTRFWPASRKRHPKQFLAVGGKRSLIAETSARLSGLVPHERQLVVTSHEYVALAKKQLRKLPPENILAEPIGRNTAACVAWAALEVEKRAPNSVHCVLPSDHVIRPPARFKNALKSAALEASTSGALVTFGIRPTFAATGYGYIELGETVGAHGKIPVHRVQRFVEKPDKTRAESFLQSGRFLWNSGMFVWSTRAILAELARHAPSVHGPLAAAKSNAEIERLYPSLPSISIDVAVLEKAANVRVLPADFEWSDVGSWTAIPEVAAHDEHDNCSVGGTTMLAEDARGCIVYGKSGELTALIGVTDLVVVRAGKAILVCPKDRAQDVKKIVARLEREGPAFL